MATNRHPRAVATRAFTLLEVMVAIAILGLALSAILSAQAGMYSANVQARNLTIAGGAARCKMSEVEELLLKDGYPEIDQSDEGACCDDESPPGMTCRWSIERVTLPDPPQSDPDGGSALADAGGSGGSSALGGLGALANAASNPASIADGGLAGLSGALSQGTGPNGQTGVAGIAGMAMTIVYPQLRPLLEASIRRVTIEVVWHEGPNERTLKLVQFATSPQKGLPPTVSSTDPSLANGATPPPGAAGGVPNAGGGFNPGGAGGFGAGGGGGFGPGGGGAPPPVPGGGAIGKPGL